MCTYVVAINQHPEFPLIVAGNRDEFFDRPSVPMHYWQASKKILAGIDQVAGGSWFGLREDGRFALVLNYRNLNHPVNLQQNAYSRGLLIRDFLQHDEPFEPAVQQLQQAMRQSAGCSIVVGEISDQPTVLLLDNINHRQQHINQGVYGLSNNLIDQPPWVKSAALAKQLALQLQSASDFESLSMAIFELLRDRTEAPAEKIPLDTGLPFAIEQQLSSVFVRIKSGDKFYGTRASTILLVDKALTVQLVEKNFLSFDDLTGKLSRFHLKLA